MRSLHAFGSAVKGTIGPENDVDLVVDIDPTDPKDRGEHYFGLLFDLEDLLARPIDLLEKRSLSNKYLIHSIEANKKGLYAA